MKVASTFEEYNKCELKEETGALLQIIQVGD
jgi:hypothetical protein